MSFQTVPAGQGLKWITDSVNLILRNPAPYALMGLVVAVAALIPILGSLALAVLGPALYGGIMYAAREHEGGGTPDFKHLFQAFNEPGKLPKMLILCLPGIAAGVLIGILAVVFLGGALIGAGITGATNSGSAFSAGMGMGLLVFFLLALAIGIFSYALTFFATPRAMLENIEPVQAMRESLKACIANVGALLVYIGVLLAACIAVTIVLGFISPIVAQLVLMVAFVPVASVAAYRASREIFGLDGTAQKLPPTDAPAPPPPPSFEA